MLLTSNHPFLANSRSIAEITAPLKKLGITFFNYSKHTENGGRVYLETNSAVTERYLSEKEYLIGNTESNPENYKDQVVLWSRLPNQVIFQRNREKNIDHGMFLIKKGNGFCEFFGFATTVDNYQIINTYLNYLDELKSFTDYFKVKAAKLISQADKEKIFLPFHNNPTNFVNLDIELDFNDELYSQLSKRQKECALMLLNGMTTKEISEALKLSQRTIETYVNNLKYKLHCQNKTQLIIKLAQLFKDE